MVVLSTPALHAEPPVPPARVVVLENMDLPGGDLASLFDTSHDACERACLTQDSCEAYTFNTRNGSCFLKADPGAPAAFVGAVSALKLLADPAIVSQSEARAAELSFLQPGRIAAARQQAEGMGRAWPVGNLGPDALSDEARAAEAEGRWIAAVRHTSQALAQADRADLWNDHALRVLGLLRSGQNTDGVSATLAISSAINAQLRADSPAMRHTAIMTLSQALEQNSEGESALAAARVAQGIVARADTEAEIDRLSGLYGFRITDHQVEADLAQPRICAEFNGVLQTAGVDYADYLRLARGDLAVEADDHRLCVTGITHGERQSVIFRAGLPAADGQTLAKDVELNFYVKDRSPSVRMPGRGYVLPRGAEAALPVETVNTSELDLELFRVSDRNILRALQEQYISSPTLYRGDDNFTDQIGASVWRGTATVGMEVNRDVTTRLPLTEALKDQPAGVYALSAVARDSEDYALTWQWFVLSDIGLTSLSGVDGLHVFARSLGTAEAMAGIELELLSRANAVLGKGVTDDQGYLRFEPGLARGTGGAAPGLLVARGAGGDLTFLSLTEPEFDLSDRGVSGRQPAPPVDVFVTTDRGAYRAGETVHVTALARDPQARAVEGLPLTAILKRPDGIEHSRQLVEDQGAGGHVFALPISGTASRGAWTLALHADVEAKPLAVKSFLVEDFLPERIDFTVTLPETALTLPGDDGAVEVPSAQIAARYLFGAPAADLAIEGELVLRAANGLSQWPGYVFGRHDQPFETLMETLDGGRTAEDGSASVSLVLPSMADDPGRPLEYAAVVRVAEGSGRPVERRVTGQVALRAPLIGVKPLFDGVVREGSKARFQLIGLGRDLALQPMQAAWTLERIETRYQWYENWGSWNWEPVTRRTKVATGEVALGGEPVEIGVDVDWGEYVLRVERPGTEPATTTLSFYAGWYAPADVTSTPDTLELSLDRKEYRAGDTAELRLVPRAAGKALITVLSNRLITMKAVDVTEGENIVSLPVTEEWGAGVYVTASVLRPMDVAAGRNPARALGLAHALIDPGARALAVTIEAPAETSPRGPLPIVVKVDGVAAGEQAMLTLAAVDQGILNLTGFKDPDPKGHYFAQRKLGVAIRDVYGRLIDGLNGAEGQVRSGGDAGANARLQAPPPTEELVSWFTGPLTVGADGRVEASFDLPAFNGSVRLMAVAWSPTAVGLAGADVLVRDPVVVTASVPRFMAPGDSSRMLLEFVHATGPAGPMALTATAIGGVSLGEMPGEITLTEGGRARIEVPVSAENVTGLGQIEVTLTPPGGQPLKKTLLVPLQRNDAEVARISRMDLPKGDSFTLDQVVFSDLEPGNRRAMLALGPLARFNAPALLDTLDNYPWGCTEQLTSRAMPLLQLDQVARVMELKGAANLRQRIDESIVEVLENQGDGGGFGLWSAGGGDLWLDAYVTDFLSRARAQGHNVPDLAFRNALANLRNRVNAAPDFAVDSNGGGTDLAYAMMVLAREGAAAIGDLRYHADVKADDFATPLAQAQLGAALAAYGEQARADAMFRKAGNRIAQLPLAETEQLWRADYGTNYRDTAAILTLAVEAGSNAIDRDTLIARLSQPPARLSTQEAAWALMATSALLDSDAHQGIRIDGAAPDGPLLRVMRDSGPEKVVIENGGPNTVMTLTTFGVPLEPEPAGGNGYGITRSYHTLDGQPVSLSEGVAAGERMVVVLEVTPYAAGAGRLLVEDALPAGLEIDNPNLISAGQISQLDWLGPTAMATHSEFRQERFMAAIDWSSRDSFRLAYMVRAISPGSFHHPAASVEDMYRPEFRARTNAGHLEVLPR